MAPQHIMAIWLFIIFVYALFVIWLQWVLKMVDRKTCPICNLRKKKVYQIEMKSESGNVVWVYVCEQCFRKYAKAKNEVSSDSEE